MTNGAMTNERERLVMGKTGLGRLVPIAALALLFALPGCVSMGAKVPETLLTLSADSPAQAGPASSGTLGEALAVIEPAAPQKLDVRRVPVQVDASTIAYLTDALWVEKPARLFRSLLADRIRADGKWLVIDGVDRQYSAGTRVTGQLLDMGYDARTQSVVVRFEALFEAPGGRIATRRFESIVPGVGARPAQVGPALNKAANDVAAQISQWVAEPGVVQPAP
jgi:cholesterol transport system auxiliary component